MKKLNLNNPPAQPRGFALVSCVSVMVLLLVIALGMLSLSAVTVRTAGEDAAMIEARSNARMALMLAIDKLQLTMGPDTRITARAELLSSDERINVAISPNTPRAWWVGVSSSDPTQIVDLTTGHTTTWLVSGLNPQLTPGQQLATPQPFTDPVTMYGDRSIDTAMLTAGQPIEAGLVSVQNGSSPRPGKYAWLIDDNGMKAQLAAARSEVNNDQEVPYGQGLLPGTYDLGVLDGMNALTGRTSEELNRLLSINDLPLLGADHDIVREKRMSYTTSSRGVLADVKHGGLKKDLTIAFERDDVFESIWGTGYDDSSNTFNEEYVVMDSEKFNQSDDLKGNGYIHWEMFKDYYNTKKYIQKDPVTGMDYLDFTRLSVGGISEYTKNDVTGGRYLHWRGQLGPHQLGPNANGNPAEAHPHHNPYGDYATIETADNSGPEPPIEAHYKHSPIGPVLMRMQLNGWLETVEKDNQFTPEPDLETYIRTKCQMWFSQYNPYNIGMRVKASRGPSMDAYPNLNFSHKGMTVELIDRNNVPSQRVMHDRYMHNFNGLTARWLEVVDPDMLGPGRSHVYAFERNIEIQNNGRMEDKLSFGDEVRDLTTQSVYRDYRVVSDSEDTLTVKMRSEGTMTHGADAGGGGRTGTVNWQMSQAFWAPFSYGEYGNWLFEEEDVGLDDLNENLMASFSFHLRTSSERTSGAGTLIRPLVDSNIRATYNNTRWDSPLGLPVLASYSMENGGEVDEQIMQMDIRDSPKGYAYWGAGRDPVDGYDRVVLFDIAREDLVSLGQLQHTNAGRFSYEPTYIVGNSHANLRIPQDQWKDSITDTQWRSLIDGNPPSISGEFSLYDASYLVNEVLWDSSIFTTIPQVHDDAGASTLSDATDVEYESLLQGATLLANPRFIPYEPVGSSFDKATLQDDARAFHHNAGHLMVDGAFNVNSTSVDAWEAFLSGTKGLPYLKFDGNGEITGYETDIDGVRFPRLKATMGGPMDKDDTDENFWVGFRALSSEEVRELAAEIVAEIKKRGPFLTMGEFVNRKLDNGELGQRGALQAALDNTINKDIDGNFSGNTNHPDIPTESRQGAGYPGHLLQGDILQSLSPYMTVRSDTFTIRAYGETLSPDGSKVLARAWCEATVQRYPDPVSASGGDALSELANPSSVFGRVFRVTSFRWLNPEEI